MRKLVILGASGHGKVVADTALMAGWDEAVFFDDAWPELKTNGPFSVLGNTDALSDSSHEFDGVVVAIGDNHIRLKRVQEFLQAGLPVPVLVHPRSYVSGDVFLADGTVVFAGAVIQPSCKLGVGCIVNTAASIDHDCVVADAVHVCPGAHLAGGISVGKCSWIGIGASVNQYLCIGDRVVVGAGSVVVSDIPDGVTVAGNPARIL